MEPPRRAGVGPRIQYAKTSDGVSIAYWTLGEGMSLVAMPAIPFSHLELEWQTPQWRRWFERLAEKRMVVRYDGRGWGLSNRDVTDYSLEALVLDLEAVVERLGLERFALMGNLNLGPVAIAYSARNPQRVSHLLMWCSWARASDFYRSPRLRALREVLQTDWELYTETMSHLVFGFAEGEPAHEGASHYRENVSPEALRMAVGAFREFDVAPLLPQVRPPSLVLHRRQVRLLDVNVARQLASQIPDAQLVLQDGHILLPWRGDTDAVFAAIDEFLGEGEESDAKAELPEGMAVLLFADIAESTALTEQLGDAAFRAKARELDTSLRAVIRECAGTPVEGKVLGDGVLAVFTSARQAIECALRCNAAGDSVGLQLHLGIHAGDVIREEDPDGRANVYGGAVNIAARIAGASAAGEILVSDTVRGLARTSAGVEFNDRGDHELKGVGEPQRLFAVRSREEG